ncbi:hypothetical protein SDRG_06720 [Saprolegnia diclina VS20]|uniref:Uncharacterized protein n=1 Tax=Saprolegnia diclina (strain VS20) TaxID=1156394 RepID=T0RUA9_SAPDV|nr:hypothetical protein SDRG_06720 [Saprolegnia diclina VS20]EQC35978.1 hypothetical protein SDRG_06720 [Saprolegnia diclina VS20]|eukprot:XP_008610740.1 hypothetical protein SDRG_06720 [Saprolegnia diclina VS20]
MHAGRIAVGPTISDEAVIACVTFTARFRRPGRMEYGRPPRRTTQPFAVDFLYPASAKPKDDRDEDAARKTKPRPHTSVRRSMQEPRQRPADVSLTPSLRSNNHEDETAPVARLKPRPSTAAASIPRLESESRPQRTETLSAYLQQLQADIRCVYQLLGNPDALSSGHAHLLLKRRDHLAVPDDVAAKLARCDGLDESTKHALETMLSDGLLLVMNSSLLDADAKGRGAVETHHPSASTPATLYFESFLAFARRVQALKTKALADDAEKHVLLTTLRAKDATIATLEHEIVLFKDTLATVAKEKDASGAGWAVLQEAFKRGAQRSADEAAKLDALQSAYDSLVAAHEALQADKTTLRKDLDALKTAHADVVARLNDQLVAANERASRAETSLHALEQTQAELRRKLECAMGEEETTRTASQAQLSSLKAELAQAKKAARTLTAQIEANAATAATQRAAAVAQATSNLQKAQATRLDDVRAEWSAECSAIQALHARELRTLEAAHAKNIDAMAVRHREMEAQLAAAAKQAALVHDEALATWRQKHERQAHEANALQHQLEAMRRELVALQVSTSESTVRAHVHHEVEGVYLAKVAALEAALAQAMAACQAAQDQGDLALAHEKELHAHALANAKAVSDELETANLCLAERKRQRDADQLAFEEREARAARNIAQLTQEVTLLRSHVDDKAHAVWKQRLAEADATAAQWRTKYEDAAKALQVAQASAEITSFHKREMDGAMRERDEALDHLVRVSKERDGAGATVVTLRNQIDTLTTALHEARTTAHRLRSELSGLEHLLTQEKRAHDQQQRDLDVETQRIMEDKQLLKQVVAAMTERLALGVRAEDATKWAGVVDACAAVDWQLRHMKDRLEELAGVKPRRPTTPFSDAIAAGQRTAPVVQQLQTAVPDTDTYAMALTREMQAMKATYEARIRDLQDELKAVRTDRARNELQEEKARYVAAMVQWTDKNAALEAKADELERRLQLGRR